MVVETAMVDPDTDTLMTAGTAQEASGPCPRACGQELKISDRCGERNGLGNCMTPNRFLLGNKIMTLNYNYRDSLGSSYPHSTRVTPVSLFSNTALF